MDNSTNIQYLWQDKKRILGMPISFTKYSISNDRIFVETGLLNTKFDEVLLYRVRDLSLSITLGQRIFGVGSVLVHSSDKTTPHLLLQNVKNPMQVKELLHNTVEKIKVEKGVRVGEYIEDDGHGCNDCN